MATEQDYRRFYQGEIAIRRLGFYPPFSRVLRLIIRSENENELLDYCAKMETVLHEYLEPAALAKHAVPILGKVSPEDFIKFTNILGPQEAPIYRLKKLHRYHLVIRSIYPEAAKGLIRTVRRDDRLKTAKVSIQLDPDPTDMM